MERCRRRIDQYMCATVSRWYDGEVSLSTCFAIDFTDSAENISRL